MRTCATVVLIAMLAPASADRSLAKERAAPKALAQLAKEHPKKAAAGFEKLIAQARKSMDLVGQMEAGTHAFSLVPIRDRRLRPAEAMPLLIKSLSSPKSYAFFSAHHLAYKALLQATRSGDYSGLGPAFALAAKRGKSGAYARAMALYAQGLRSVAGGAPAEAVKPLASTLDACAASGWSQLALHCGLELTLAQATTEAADAAPKVLQETLAAVRADTVLPTLWQLKTAISKRLQPRHPELYAAWNKALDDRIRKYGASKGSTPGGAGRPGGAEKPNALCKALRKWSKRKPLVQVTRVRARFRIEYGFGDFETTSHKRPKGIRHITQGGLTLALYENGVRVEYVVLIVGEPAPGEGAGPSQWQYFDNLADGETWSLLATGEIRIK